MHRITVGIARAVFIAYLCAHAVAAIGAPAEHAIEATTSTATVAIALRNHNQRSIRLPALRYDFELDVACARPYLPESVSITVADSAAYVDAEELLDDGETEVTLTVPAGQIGPVTAERFCRAAGPARDSASDEPPDEAEQNADTTLPVPGALSAHISLRCSDGQQEEVVYVSRPLDVMLECQHGTAEAAISSSSASE